MARGPLHQLPREPWYTRGGGLVPRAPSIMWSLCRRLVASLALISCAVWYAQTHFYRDPGSRFFDPSRAYEQKYSRHRRAEVQQFIEQYASRHTGAAHDAPTPGEPGAGRSLCVTFTSVRRQRIQYVEVSSGLPHHDAYDLGRDTDSFRRPSPVPWATCSPRSARMYM